MYEEALAELQKARDSYQGWQPDVESFIGIIYANMGKNEEAQQVLNNLLEREKQEYVPPMAFANLCFALKENDLGFQWLDKALEIHDPGLTWIEVHPLNDPIRTDPKFIATLKRMKLDN